MHVSCRRVRTNLPNKEENSHFTDVLSHPPRSSPLTVLPRVRPAGHRGLLHHGVRRPAVLRLPRLAHVRVGHRHRDGPPKVHHQTGRSPGSTQISSKVVELKGRGKKMI